MIYPDWPLQGVVGTLSTTRQGGVSAAPFDGFNLACHVGDNPQAVADNRAQLQAQVPVPIVWLEQVHGNTVILAEDQYDITHTPPADAIFTRSSQFALAIMTADCLPVLIASQDGQEIAAVHCGWRPLVAGILAKTLAHFKTPASQLHAWLGPAIGPQAFEVGKEVVDQFVALSRVHSQAFVRQENGQYLADIYLLARQQLSELGVTAVSEHAQCTVSNPEHFFSYRRDGRCGRMASLIWRK
ncbi:peptidoglycan editing factor PgeF [Pseudoalteromonas rubra]|uniref:Purine nucleoside phosphorylase n=1 Tax=Pseudoalteromonas rubra TaxID=43658 RepID=A0A5S3WJ57_9GAMM|nr:peptidoglycan editing factor PgeF [Pseudoalteromonas rubra]TMP27330.1 peptidoglycan editing factor PgeF [Pseudoalteromonas rubra]TMP36868.1 peptidoglycan editing factor PgeF [Pseudoalteromonas rubra]